MAVSVASSSGASVGSMKTMSTGVMALRADLCVMSSAPLMIATSSVVWGAGGGGEVCVWGGGDGVGGGSGR